jgi:hypothetical protein
MARKDELVASELKRLQADLRNLEKQKDLEKQSDTKVELETSEKQKSWIPSSCIVI